MGLGRPENEKWFNQVGHENHTSNSEIIVYIDEKKGGKWAVKKPISAPINSTFLATTNKISEPKNWLKDKTLQLGNLKEIGAKKKLLKNPDWHFHFHFPQYSLSLCLDTNEGIYRRK